VRTLNRLLLTQEAFIMPGKAAKTGLRKNGFSTTFVNYKLTGKEKEDFIKFAKGDFDTHSKRIVEAMSNGMKFSFSENRENGTAIASLTCRDEGNINFDRCITSRSPDWYEALLMCVFKLDVLGGDNDWLDQAGSDDWG